MNPILISTNTNQIATDKAALVNRIEIFQNVYDALKAIGITATLEDISRLISLTINRNGQSGFLEDYVLNKLLDAAAPYSLNGIQLQRNKVKEMIVAPDVSGVKTALAEANQMGNRVLEIDLLTLANDVVGKVDNSDSIIEGRLTFYTKTDASTALANDLQVVCDALNNFDSIHNKYMLHRLSGNILDYRKQHGQNEPNPFSTAIWGIELRNKFVISLAHIRAFESNNPV